MTGTDEAPARRRRTESIEDAIKDMIVRHGLKPGDRLPHERELMAMFGASKGTVREALSALAAQGLVTSRTGPGGGLFLAAMGPERMTALLSNYFLFRTPSIEDIYAVRCELEPELAASVAGRLSARDFTRLEATMRLYDAPPATAEEEYAQRLAELDFHGVLADLSPNPVLGLVCGFLQRLLKEMAVCRRIYETPHPVLRQTSLHYQVELLKALRAGDGHRAGAIMAEHMAAARDYMVSMEASIASGFLPSAPRDPRRD
jgi:DNA-binding FadR family transcriptional regulator